MAIQAVRTRPSSYGLERGSIQTFRPGRRFLASLLFVVFVSLFPDASRAATFSIPLPGFVGVADFGSSLPLEASFDFGQRFVEIERVSIELKAHVFARKYDHCFAANPRLSCIHRESLPGFDAQIDDGDERRLGVLYAGVRFLGEPGATEFKGIGVGVFRASYFFDSNQILDGAGRIRLWTEGLLLPAIGNVLNYEAPRGKIYRARLQIEGTPIPEPTTATLIMAGLAVLSGTRLRRSLPGA